MSEELPKIISDEEFDALLKQRRQLERPEHDRWDNAGIRKPPKPTDGLPESTIEQKFPHVAQKLTVLWPSEACAIYIRNLAILERDSRQGFPEDVLEDLMMLYEINEMLMRKSGVEARKGVRPRWERKPSPRR